MSSTHRFRMGALAALVSVIATMLAIAPTASASADTESHSEYIAVNPGWARASVEFTWGHTSLTDGVYHVLDGDCNGIPVYARVQAYINGTWKNAAARWNKSGCGSGYAKYSFSSMGWGVPIDGVRLRVCEENAVRCFTSAYHDNPHA